ncbi:hypothetical protein, partial [Actinomyces dentalis]|uniref:hypothetical protein n=1 Tax=Actinomyces dentalis TaxID=272548 RepID=UPI002357225F
HPHHPAPAHPRQHVDPARQHVDPDPRTTPPGEKGPLLIRIELGSLETAESCGKVALNPRDADI